MKASNRLYKVLVIAAIILLSAQSSCAPAAQIIPTETPIPDTPTPADTATPTVTAAPTETPLPTATFTPAVTATQIPEVTPPAEGRGNIVGLVLWNDLPVAEAAVWLCTDWKNYQCIDRRFANTDPDGYYVFQNIPPGTYIVAMNSFSSSWFIFYFDANGNREQDLSAGQSLILDPWSIYKFDLRIESPANRQALSEAKPTFQWQAYAEAAYYEISIFDQNQKTVIENQRVDGTEFTPVQDLVTCAYTWYVEAFNAAGTLISHNVPVGTAYYASLLMYFRIIDVPGSCSD